MKITRNLILIVFVVAAYCSYGYSQTKPPAKSCDWDIALPPTSDMTSQYALWDLQDGRVTVTCFADVKKERPQLKTDQEVRDAVVKEIFNSVYKADADAKITSQNELSIGGYSGKTYSVNTLSRFLEMRVFAHNSEAYVLMGMAPTSEKAQRLRKVLASFTIEQ